MIYFIKQQKGLEPHVAKIAESFLKRYPKEVDEHFFQHTYSTKISHLGGHLKFYVELLSYLDVPTNQIHRLEQQFWGIVNPEANRVKKQFQKHLGYLLPHLKRLDKEVLERIKPIALTEAVRLEESMRALNAHCYLSSVVMSVSAVEYRLHKLLERTNKKLYRASFKEATLGGIIKIFRPEEYKDKKYKKIKEILPDKHKPLMEMLNIYRIFSAHPKEEEVSGQLAKTILSLSFLLLIDKDLEV